MFLYHTFIRQGSDDDPSTCRRCGGKTFEMERKTSKKGSWHTKCFCCVKCSKPFQSYDYVYEGSDNEIYCEGCHKKSFPEVETPKIYSDTTKIRTENTDNACPRCNGAVFAAEQMEIKGRVGDGVRFNPQKQTSKCIDKN